MTKTPRSLLVLIAVSLLTALSPETALARWTREAEDVARREFQYFPGPQHLPKESRGAIATVWGCGMRTFRTNGDLSKDKYEISIAGYFKKSLTVYLRRQERRAPLAVILPGVFSNGDDAFAKRQIEILYKLGYHVLSLPNAWSTDFAKARPIYQMKYPLGEAQIVRLVANWAATKEIGAKNVDGAHIVGESLGALTAAVAYAVDSKTDNPIFTEGATLTWPPVDLSWSVAKLDSMMRATDEIYQRQCKEQIKSIKTKWRIVRGRYILNPTDAEVACAPSVVAQYSFRKDLIKLAEQISKSEKMNRDVSEKLTFKEFIDSFAPRYRPALDARDPYGKLDYWLEQTSRSAASKIRILTTDDDFLIPSHLSPLKIDGFEDQIIVANWGGHVGLANTDAYKNFIKAQFAFR